MTRLQPLGFASPVIQNLTCNIRISTQRYDWTEPNRSKSLIRTYTCLGISRCQTGRPTVSCTHARFSADIQLIISPGPGGLRTIQSSQESAFSNECGQKCEHKKERNNALTRGRGRQMCKKKTLTFPSPNNTTLAVMGGKPETFFHFRNL